MKQKNTIPDPVLIILSIMGIVAFQFYWLKENYEREGKALAIKTEVAFQQTIQQLQIAKLKLNGIGPDSVHRRIKYLIEDDSANKSLKGGLVHKDAFFSTINIIRDKLKDSLKKNPDAKTQMIISINETGMNHDSVKFDRQIDQTGPNRLIQFLYGVDSLQDTLKLKEIDSAYHLALKKENLDIPFSILELSNKQASAERAGNEVTVGFANPVTYKVVTRNTTPYLIRRLMLPIFLSVLLLGITILAFVLLYRNMVRQRRLGELKNEFISNITHELKTPIATVGVAIEALKNFNAIHDPLRTKEYLDISSNELLRLNLLVDKVLKLSMFEKKEVELKYEAVNLLQIVEEVVESLKLQFEKCRATVTVGSTGDAGLQGDQLHLVSVVFNLLDNALKYVKDNPVIHINITGKENSVVLEVSDNGIGIAPEYRVKVFEKFFRIPHGDTHNAKGYGLGLSYAAQVIQKHKGSITIEGQPVIGTKFIITLPKTYNIAV